MLIILLIIIACCLLFGADKTKEGMSSILGVIGVILVIGALAATCA